MSAIKFIPLVLQKHVDTLDVPVLSLHLDSADIMDSG